MSLLDEARGERHRRPSRCQVALAVAAGLDADDLADALAAPGVVLADVAKAVRARGHHLTRRALSTHRNMECGC